MSAIPEEMKKKHYKLRDDKEKMEKDRNKIALKIQKIKDRVIPKIQKEVLGQLDGEFEDIDRVELKGAKAIAYTFSHLEEFKKRFLEKRNAIKKVKE